MNEINEILGRLRFHFGVKNDTELAEVLGIPYKTLDGWKTRKSIPTSRLQDISNSEKLSLDWIMKGEGLGSTKALRRWWDGGKHNKENADVKLDGNIREVKGADIDLEAIRSQSGEIPLRYFENVTASAGYGSQNSDESFEPLSVSAEFLKAVFGITAAKYGYDMIRIFGDSMEPFVQNGDIIFVDRQKEIMSGDVVIAEVGEDTFIKKFLRDSVHKSIKLTSLSDFYQDIVLKDDEIENSKLLGKIVCKFSINIKVF
ncbi:LexA family transcriptional regulator [uncultured Campylobacter sp.]|uniref:LexA family transcriptional regulator n=2 Tax=uncultured Campylobacter sp. TaxID=218934 RepID=UPI00261E886C|nr:LexA family transcriptional regulator [uncultured Campylobacter sp.]